jgi:hypothetical protein
MSDGIPSLHDVAGSNDADEVSTLDPPLHGAAGSDDMDMVITLANNLYSSDDMGEVFTRVENAATLATPLTGAARSSDVVHDAAKSQESCKY